MPSVVISGASRGAFRSRRRATRSMVGLRMPQKIIAPSIAASTPKNVTMPDWVPSSPSLVPAIVTVIIVPHMNTSPWAKLISSMMP